MQDALYKLIETVYRSEYIYANVGAHNNNNSRGGQGDPEKGGPEKQGEGKEGIEQTKPHVGHSPRRPREFPYRPRKKSRQS